MIAQRVGPKSNTLPPLSPKVQSLNSNFLIPFPSAKEIPIISDKDEESVPADNSNTETDQVHHQDPNANANAHADPKRLKRIVASRQYSQKYRLKQLQYISQLETEVKALQAEVAIASPRIKYSDRQNALLRAENSSIKQRLSAFSGELLFKEAQYEELKKERDSLKQFSEVYQQQMSEMLRNGPAMYQMVNTMSLNQSARGLNQFPEPVNPPNHQNLNQFAPGLQFININNNNNTPNPDHSYNFM
ncbi:basic leucine zipper 61-like [Ziziphus jujuba]|uniref:Basic leucine zipper 61-like n=1 Tax=Ziziphus jujuba TaxID=326968 RepID=A0ABM3ZUG2_ZIZJJ|nr:basic leucine zipper 61-like [Ziziphus jujuba]